MSGVIIQTAPTSLTNGQLHNRKAVLRFGVLQVLFGILLVILDIIAFTWYSPADNRTRASTAYGSGCWGGGYFVITGIFGVLAGRIIPPQQGPRVRRGFLITSLVLSIPGFILALTMSVLIDNDLVLTQWILLHCSSCILIPGGTEAFSLLAAHTAFFSIMMAVNLGQVVSTSVNIHKLPNTARSLNFDVNYGPYTIPSVADQQTSSTTDQTDHARAKVTPLVPADWLPPPYESLPLHSHIQHADGSK
ncbi:uncharacterized protein LOC129593027 [Paramacrobiotus metropolitanus]|uniref:uncharacterized protein LOC129593027 n=1 Tax=Paramacrobiotus metropolitanus TaxID=2943436 RepID=UPI0024457544|nr:uncharacterized protein LOC129593027 [Paramacrobiotus metropolitanus]XP_055345184.1 uncharacterized protein LOC129593027 [Paramacrobiotus metropolitanus]